VPGKQESQGVRENKPLNPNLLLEFETPSSRSSIMCLRSLPLNPNLLLEFETRSRWLPWSAGTVIAVEP